MVLHTPFRDMTRNLRGSPNLAKERPREFRRRNRTAFAAETDTPAAESVMARTSNRRSDSLHGTHVRVRVSSPTKDFTTLHNTVYRNQFQLPDKTRIRLRGVERAALLHLLSFSWDRADDPEWRLDMKEFVGDFTESRSTVYAALQRLEELGFLLRHRENDPESGQFEWYWEVTDKPGTLATKPQARAGGMRPGMKPQVTPRAKKTNVGNPATDNGRSGTVQPRSEKPYMDSPHMAELDAATSYRENPYLPSSHNHTLSDAREGGPEGRGAQPDESRTMAPPPAGSRSTVRARVAAEADRTPDPAWVEFAATLSNHPAARGRLMPNRSDQELIALRCQLAAEHGWTEDQLTRLLLADLHTSQSLTGVWLHRLHPEHLPVAGRAPAPAAPTRSQPSSEVAEPSVTAARIAEIRAAAGTPRGDRWAGLMANAS